MRVFTPWHLADEAGGAFFGEGVLSAHIMNSIPFPDSHLSPNPVCIYKIF
jgi:hypothetical protein